MGDSKQRKRQLDLAAAELARSAALSGPVALGAAKPWLAWMRSGDFQAKADDWEFLAELCGRELAKSGCPALASLPVLAQILEHGRSCPEREFSESRFIQVSFSSAWSAGSVHAASFTLLLELEASRRAHDLGKKKIQAEALKAAGSRKRPPCLASGVFEGGMPSMDASGCDSQQWEQCCQAGSGPAASWLWALAWRSCGPKDGLPASEMHWAKASRAAQVLDAAQAQSELADLSSPWRFRPSEGASMARAGALLTGRGALWGQHPPPAPKKREWSYQGRAWSPMQCALMKGQPEALPQALEQMGADEFWRQAKELCLEQARRSGSGAGSPKEALALAKTLSSLDSMPKGVARLLLRAASAGAWKDSDQNDAEISHVVRECFELLSAKADLGSSSPWSYPGFAKAAAVELRAEESEHPKLSAKAWASDRRGHRFDFESGRALSTGFGALIDSLAKGGAPLPWEPGAGAQCGGHPALGAMLEAWEIARESKVDAQACSTKAARL